MTKPKDEDYCIATLLKSDPTSVLEQGTSGLRIAALWRLLLDAGLISRKIALHYGKKVELRVGRWALSICLQRGSALAFLDSSLNPAFVVAEGLRIQESGLIVARPSGTRIQTSDAGSDTSQIRLAHGAWSTVEPADTHVSCRKIHMHQKNMRVLQVLHLPIHSD